MKLGISLFSAGVLALAALSPAVAAENIYLAWPGVIGSSQVARLQGTIPLKSYSQSFVNAGTVTTPGKTTCGAITITKQTDSASTSFLMAGFKTTIIPKLTVYFTDSSSTSASLVIPVQIVLLDAAVFSVNQSVDTTVGNITTLNETITLKATTFEVTYSPILANGSLGPAEKFGWNCATNSAVAF